MCYNGSRKKVENMSSIKSYVSQAIHFFKENEELLTELGFFDKDVSICELNILLENYHDSLSFSFSSGIARVCLIDRNEDFVIKRNIHSEPKRMFSCEKEYDNFLNLDTRYSHLFVAIEKFMFKDIMFYVEEKVNPLFARAEDFPEWDFSNFIDTCDTTLFLTSCGIIDDDEAEYLEENFEDIHDENCGWRIGTNEWVVFDYSD